MIEQIAHSSSISLFSIGDRSVTLGQLLIATLLLIAGYALSRWGARWITTTLQTRRMKADGIQLALRIFYVLAFIVTLITALEILNIPLTAFAFVSGAVAIGIGFGAQNIINNFISGWILMWERPIKIGDFLEVANATGTVEAINTRSTRIRRVDGVHMLVPNSFLLENTVVNWTLIDATTRTTVRVGAAYGSPVEKVAALIKQALDEHSNILKTPAPAVFFEDFGDSSLVFDASMWINVEAERGLRMVRSEIRFAIAKLFDDNGIVIAFPQRDIHIDGTLQLTSPP